MPHIRTQLRNAVEAAFSSLSHPSTVSTERQHRLDAGMLPAVVFYITSAEPQDESRSMTGAYTVEMAHTLAVEMHADGVDGKTVAESLDQMDLEVEAVIAQDTGIMSVAEIVEVGGSEIEWNTEQDRVLGMRSTSYILTTRHQFGAPDTPEG